MSMHPMVNLLASTVLLILALILFIPIAVLFVECLMALLSEHTQKPTFGKALPKMAVLVPAHNEALGIRPVLEGIVSQLHDSDRLIVIADNCTDETAAIARSTGATVIERQDANRRGKGYALDYGVRYLANNPPDVVVIVDADCMVQAGTLERITQQAAATQRPVQSLYLLEQPAQPKPKDAVSALAILVKNLVRPRGLATLGLPCPLAGTGMAFPWSVIENASLASGNIVEDMQLGIDLAIAGYPPMFCPHTKVMGLLPQQQQAAKSQRTRWEHGHLQTILTQVPRLLKAALAQKRFDLLAIALDLSVPPLSLLVMLWMAVLIVSVLAGFLGFTWLPALILALEGFMIFAAILGGWAKFGRSELPAQTLLAVPLYVLWKIPLYFAFILKRQTEWVRTDRDAIEAEKSQN